MATAAVPMALSLASTGFGLAAKSQQAGAEAGADTYKAGQADLSAKIGQVQASQTDTFYRQQLQRSLGNIQAVQAASGTTGTSPTDAAVLAGVTGQADRERQQKLDNINSQVASDQGAAAFYQHSASSAISAGTTGILGTLAGGLGGAFKSMSVGGAGGGLDVGFQGWMPSF